MALDFEYRPDHAPYVLRLETSQVQMREMVDWGNQNFDGLWNFSAIGAYAFFPHYPLIVSFWFESVTDATLFRLRFGGTPNKPLE